MTSLNTFTDLTNCDREQIHTPGSIQPHGFLLVVDPASWRITGASSNTRDILWREATSLIGTEIASVLGDEIVPALEKARRHADFKSRAIFLRNLSVDVGGETKSLSLVAHASAGAVILEGEPGAHFEPLSVEQELQTFLARLSETESLDEMYQLAVKEVRRITGFDRCLLYRFDPDWNGVVIAEDRNKTLPAYLNQCFPASDIPRQARELYRRNRLRLIPTNSYQPVPIITKADTRSATALDLSLSVLRSVSPIHLEYMRNMGTGSSMSISVMRNQELWGLISCHSLEPRFVPFATRAACDLIGQFLSLQMTAREQARDLAFRVELTGVLTRLLSNMARSSDYADGATGADLLRLGDAGGAAIVQGKRIVVHGNTPSRTDIAALSTWIAAKKKHLVFWNHLWAEFPESGGYVDVASGILAVRIEGENGATFIWFRPELVNVIEWGGEPRKAIEAAGAGRMLHPRKSFETWRETVRGRSRPWQPAVVATVRDFRDAIESIVVKRRAS